MDGYKAYFYDTLFLGMFDSDFIFRQFYCKKFRPTLFDCFDCFFEIFKIFEKIKATEKYEKTQKSIDLN
jgi:hypothetical protein